MSSTPSNPDSLASEPSASSSSVPTVATESSKRSLWPLGIIATIVLFTSINMVMVSIAYRNPSVPATKDHWAESVAFDEEYKRRVASQALGWRAEITACRDPLPSNKAPGQAPAGSSKQNCALRFKIVDRQQREVSGLSGSVSIRRGDSAQFDRQASIRPQDGGYVADLELGRPGYYDLKLELQKGPSPWQSQRRMWLGPKFSPKTAAIASP